VDTIPNDNTNNTSTNNVTSNAIVEDLPQLLDSRGGSHVINVLEFDVEDFTSWKDRFLVYIDGLEHYLFKILDNGPFVPKSSLSTTTNILIKLQKQWSPEDRRLANQHKRVKNIIISCLPNDVMKSVIKCTTAQSMWNDLILAHEGPSDTRDTKIVAIRLKFNDFKALEGENVQGTFTRLKILLNGLENKGVSIPQAKVTATFVNSLPRKWLSMNQTQRANNSIKNDSLLLCLANTTMWKKDYRGKYKALKSELVVLTKKIDALSKSKSKKGLVAESLDWDEESLSSKDEGVTGVKAFIAIVEDEPDVGKVNARFGQWVDITMKKKVIEKWTSSKVTLDQLLTKQVPRNIVCALGGRGKRKEIISSKEVVFTKEEKSPSETVPEITSDSELEYDNHKPLSPLSKLSRAETIGTSTDVTPPVDLTQTLTISDKTKQVDKESSVKVIKKKTQTKSPSVPDPSLVKKADLSTEQLLFTLMEETLAKLKAQSSQASYSRKAPKIPKPFIPCKYCGFNDHHSDECKYYPKCDICGSIAYAPADYDKRTSSIRKPRIANQRSIEPIEKNSKESSPNVVFGDNSLGDNRDMAQ
ncbi:hypothetical protein Tco_0860778, partial [Tanacetum coccineum]